MQKTLLVLLGLASIASASHYPTLKQDQDPDWTPNGLNMTEFRYYYTVVRGSLDGFQKGLYADNSISLNKQCMDEKTLQDIVKLEELLSAGDIGGLFKSSGAIFSLAYTFDKTCDLNELTYELGQWAFTNTTTLEDINKAFMANLFTLTGSLNEIFQVFFGNNASIQWTDLDGCFQKYQTLGTKIGQIFRVIFNFQGKYVPNKNLSSPQFGFMAKALKLSQ